MRLLIDFESLHNVDTDSAPKFGNGLAEESPAHLALMTNWCCNRTNEGPGRTLKRDFQTAKGESD